MKEHHKRFSLHQLIDRKKFDTLVKRWGMDKGVRNFSTWEMTQALISCFVMRLGSYREVESALKIPDSTFGDALRVRHFGFFQELCDIILLDIRAKTESRKIKKAVKQILAIDSTECRVHGSLFSQPSWKQKGCDTRKASAKLHVVWDVNGEWIDDFRITGGTRNDLTVAKTFQLCKGKIYVFDRAYVDLRFWLAIIKCDSHFVTRLKRAPRKEELHRCVLSEADLKKTGVLWVGEWTPSERACMRNGVQPKKLKFRHIIFRDPESGRIFDFITSDWDLTAEEIAQIYKNRWSVELLFRWLKGHLDIRYFPARNRNAIKVQLTVAVLVQLLLQLKRTLDRIEGTLWDLLRQIRTRLIQKVLAESGPPEDCRWSAATAGGPRL
jgi:putative transposase